jgi:DNA-directed RNA polymerase subunit K/omega
MDTITNEQTLKKFKSQFELVSYAIRLTENLIKSGRNPRIRIYTQNPALIAIGEIEEGKDQIDPLPTHTPQYTEAREAPRAHASNSMNNVEKEPSTFKKSADKKKPRKLMTR